MAGVLTGRGRYRLAFFIAFAGVLGLAGCGEAEEAAFAVSGAARTAVLSDMAEALTGVACTHTSGRKIRSVGGGGLSFEAGEIAYVHERTATAAFDPEGGAGQWETVTARFAADVRDGAMVADRALGDCHVVEAYCGSGDCVSISVTGGGRTYQRYANRIEIFITTPEAAGSVKTALTRLLNGAGQ